MKPLFAMMLGLVLGAVAAVATMTALGEKDLDALDEMAFESRLRATASALVLDGNAPRIDEPEWLRLSIRQDSLIALGHRMGWLERAVVPLGDSSETVWAAIADALGSGRIASALMSTSHFKRHFDILPSLQGGAPFAVALYAGPDDIEAFIGSVQQIIAANDG